MLRGTFANIGLIVALTAVPVTAQERAGGSYELVWSDEFDTDGPPDPAKWVWDTHANKIG
jgi:hypothetical protein